MPPSPMDRLLERIKRNVPVTTPSIGGGDAGVVPTVPATNMAVASVTGEAAAEATAAPGNGTSVVTEETFQEKILHEIVEKTHVPVWGIILILVGIGLLFLCICCCCLRRWCKKRKKGQKGGKGGVDFKGMGFLSNAYKEKVQPDEEDLQENMEENEVEKESEKSEEKLGRLQYKLDYDFNSNNV